MRENGHHHPSRHMASPTGQDAGAAMPVSPKTHRPPGMRKRKAQTKREAGQKYKRTPKGTEANRFYASRRWIRLRNKKRRANPICERCGEWPTEEVHHIRPRLAHPELAYVWENLMSLCNECHGEVRADDG